MAEENAKVTLKSDFPNSKIRINSEDVVFDSKGEALVLEETAEYAKDLNGYSIVEENPTEKSTQKKNKSKDNGKADPEKGEGK